MLRRLAITLLTVGCLFAMYGLYALWVTPFVQREEQIVRTEAKPVQVGTGQRGPRSQIAVDHLPHLKWAHDAPYQMHDGDRYIFTESLQQPSREGVRSAGSPERVQGDTIRFVPFAMVVVDEEDPEKPPYTLISEAAVLRFENGFDDVGNVEPGRIVGGSLEGKFEIRGEKGLRLVGQDSFFFSETPGSEANNANVVVDASPLAWSEGEIQFEYDGHYGSGYGLEVKLIPDRKSNSRDKPAVEGIHTVRLRKDVEMHLQPRDEDPDRPPERVQINSDGPFEFDMQANTVTFEDDVRVVRRTDEGNDTLDCDSLNIVFREVAEGDDPDAAGSDDLGNLAFSRLLAKGQRVILRSEKGGIVATMRKLTYDADDKRIVMKAGNNVIVRHGHDEFHCPELTLEHDDANQIVTVVGRGAGKMWSADPETGAQKFVASWQKQVWKHPDPKSDQQVIEFHEVARLIEPNKMGIEAEVIKAWLEEDQTRRPAARRGNEDEPLSGNFKIQRLVAHTDVAFASEPSHLVGVTHKLEVWFEDGVIPRAKVAVREAGGPHNRLQRLSDRSGGRSRPGRKRDRAAIAKTTTLRPADRGRVNRRRGAQAFASTNDDIPQPDARGPLAANQPKARPERLPTLNEQPPAPKEDKPDPISIEGDLIQVRVIREGDDNFVAEVITRGNVNVEQTHNNGAKPFVVDCDQLWIRNQDDSDKHQIIDIRGIEAAAGRPEVRAHIRDRGMHVEGLYINIDRRENKMTVDGPGLMEQPVNNRLDGQALAAPEMLSVWWREKMTFNGEVAKFYDNVRIVHEDSTVTCGQMDVQLNKRISFAEDRPTDGEDPEIRRIACRDGVRLDASQFEGNLLVGKHRGEIFELTMDQSTGDMQSRGGGWMESWRREDGESRRGFGPTTATTSNKPVDSGEKEGWTYTKITFRGAMTGNISSLNDPKRVVTTLFEDDVVVVYGPVKLPNEVVSPYELPEEGGTLESDTLRLTQLPGNKEGEKPYVTMLASGNARVTGESFSGRADQISYDESKSVYTLRTGKGRNSEIWRRSRYLGQRGGRTAASHMEFNPVTKELKVIGGAAIDAQN